MPDRAIYRFADISGSVVLRTIPKVSEGGLPGMIDQDAEQEPTQTGGMESQAEAASLNAAEPDEAPRAVLSASRRT